MVTLTDVKVRTTLVTFDFKCTYGEIVCFPILFLCIKVEEMEIPRAVAERSLREHKGDVVEALVTLTN